MRVIKKDPNRRLYDTEISSYITIEDVRQLIVDGEEFEVRDARSGFNVYAVEWTPDEIRGYVNKRQYFTFKNEHASSREWPFDKPFHLLLNIAVGGTWGGEKGVDENIWPQRMEIDYVRVFRLSSAP